MASDEALIKGKRHMKKFLKWMGGLFLLALVVQGIKASQEDTPNSSQTSTSKVQISSTSLEPTFPIPDDQAKFVQAVQKGQNANKVATNDMQKGGARATREKELCSLLLVPGIANWVGDVYSISSNSDGKGVLEVTIGPDVYVKTWNNAFSDVLHHTMIDPGTSLFDEASQLKEGQKISFSGSFVRDTRDSIGCFYESSLTLDGKLSEPEFIFRFSDVSPL